jgi:hypothetical protein
LHVAGFTDDALEALGQLAAEDAFLLWELRGSLRAPGLGSGVLEVDGGSRAELPPRGGLAERAFFAVGAGPGALPDLARGRPPRPTGPEWNEAVLQLARFLDARAAEAETTLGTAREVLRETGATGLSLRLSVHARWRCWRRPGEAARAEVEAGIRVRGSWSGAAGPGNFDVTADDAAGLPWVGGEWFPDIAAPPSADPVTRLPSRYCGPVVLGAGAAAWFVHEMGHAGLEWSGARPQCPEGLRIVDDPRAGPWPAGFRFDDAGRPSFATEIWSPSVAEGPARPVYLRRASVRDRAVPALSCTNLVVDPGVRPAGPDPGVLPRIEKVRAARFDPLSRCVFLAAEDVDTGGGADGPRPGRSVTVAIKVDAVWPGARIITEPGGSSREQARCSRQGVVNSVMVGAQTLLLDPVRLHGSTGPVRDGFIP